MGYKYTCITFSDLIVLRRLVLIPVPGLPSRRAGISKTLQFLHVAI